MRLDAPVAPIANFGSSLFEKMAVRVGHSTQICGQDNLYGFLTYFLNVFKTPLSYQQQMNFPLLLYRDTKLQFDELNKNGKLFTD